LRRRLRDALARLAEPIRREPFRWAGIACLALAAASTLVLASHRPPHRPALYPPPVATVPTHTPMSPLVARARAVGTGLATPTAPTSAPKATWRWPLAGRLLLGYGFVDMPWLGEWTFHDGLDLAAPVGATVRAAVTGVVLQVRDDPLLGPEVVERSVDGVAVTYAGLGRVAVRPGQSVAAGQPLGTVGPPAPGEIGEGPHLHLAIRAGGDPVSPGHYLPLR
jgi:murein DD-endopeptidase MepM/ murein hydrolase activator NlpD